MKWSELNHPALQLPADLDGFRIEWLLEAEWTDIVLDRPPLNVVSMAQREQLRLAFEALDADARIRVIVLRAFSPLAQRTAKKLLNDAEDATLSIAIELEGHCYSRLRTSEDFREGVEAFHAKQAPRFKGS